jgi:hypothetical protein
MPAPWVDLPAPTGGYLGGFACSFAQRAQDSQHEVASTAFFYPGVRSAPGCIPLEISAPCCFILFISFLFRFWAIHKLNGFVKLLDTNECSDSAVFAVLWHTRFAGRFGGCRGGPRICRRSILIGGSILVGGGSHFIVFGIPLSDYEFAAFIRLQAV